MTYIQLKHFTPLWVCARAIRKCYGREAYSDNGGEKDKALIYKVGNKKRHKSVLEHLVITFTITGEDDLWNIFLYNPFCYCSSIGQKFPMLLVSTNVRALQEMSLPKQMQETLIPAEYKYLFEEENEN